MTHRANILNQTFILIMHISTYKLFFIIHSGTDKTFFRTSYCEDVIVIFLTSSLFHMSYCEDDIVNLLISSLFHTSYCEDVIVILLLCLCLTTIVTFILKKDGHLLCLCNQSFICDIRSCFTLYNLQ